MTPIVRVVKLGNIAAAMFLFHLLAEISTGVR